jgi:hypothetical protein
MDKSAVKVSRHSDFHAIADARKYGLTDREAEV